MLLVKRVLTGNVGIILVAQRVIALPVLILVELVLSASQGRLNTPLLGSVDILLRLESRILSGGLRGLPAGFKLILLVFGVHLGLERRIGAVSNEVDNILGHIGVIAISTASHLLQSIGRLLVIGLLIRHCRLNGFNIFTGRRIILLESAIRLIEAATVPSTFDIPIAVIRVEVLGFVVVLG